MKKNNKGFTLIELLVVVAIIGILAAVGTVAYTGYTKSAKKNAAGSNHATVVKYVAAELAKCNLESEAFKPSTGTAMDCDSKGTLTATSAALALTDFKNPYKPTTNAVEKHDTDGQESSVAGVTLISQSTSEVTISTCIEPTSATVCAETKDNTVSIE
jgi:type IV pilus assembly protein PilA